METLSQIFSVSKIVASRPDCAMFLFVPFFKKIFGFGIVIRFDWNSDKIAQVRDENLQSNFILIENNFSRTKIFDADST